MHQDVGALSMLRQVVADLGVAGNHDGRGALVDTKAEGLVDGQVLDPEGAELPVAAGRLPSLFDLDDFGTQRFFLEHGADTHLDVVGHRLQQVIDEVLRAGRAVDLRCRLPPALDPARPQHVHNAGDMVGVQVSKGDAVEVGPAVTRLDEPMQRAGAAVDHDRRVAALDDLRRATAIRVGRGRTGAQQRQLHIDLLKTSSGLSATLSAAQRGLRGSCSPRTGKHGAESTPLR